MGEPVTPASLRVATAGSVDDGKSTLVGRLLQETRSLTADQLAGARRPGTGETELALVVDGLRAEREQGITIDVAYRYFSTPRRSFVLADTPGHRQYTRNMVTGASTADVVVVLVDAAKGMTGQTRRHLGVTGLLRVPRLVVAIGKMDLVGYSESAFDEVARDFGEFAATVDLPPFRLIPLAALHGDNVTTRSRRMPWYEGPSLLEYLETVRIGAPPSRGLRLPVQYVLRGPDGRRRVTGRVAGGTVRLGDVVTVLPSREKTSVTGLAGPDGALDEAGAGRSVSVSLADELDVGRGGLVVTNPPPGRRTVRLTVCWLAESPLRAGDRISVRHGTAEIPATVLGVPAKLEIDGPGTGPATPDGELTLNDLGTVTVALAEPLWADPYRDCRANGAVLLLDPHDGDTLGAGMVQDIDEGEA
ncbi:sulfate adenylyltransferase subunit 1 [Amycolatopsis thailandensis]|uniref:sulfate adenylyltransferase subunit 1 n=1 Tax=Amycolatopsis thailandensis TaxID=589330 RepID=UPI003660B0F1